MAKHWLKTLRSRNSPINNFHHLRQCSPHFLSRDTLISISSYSLKRKILTVWKAKFWQFKKKNFDSLKRKNLTVWKRKFWQFGKQNFDSFKRKILAVWKRKFWQFKKKNFDSLERKILTVWKGNFWQFEKQNFDSLKRKTLTVWKRKFWQFKKENFWQFGKENFGSFLTVWGSLIYGNIEKPSSKPQAKRIFLSIFINFPNILDKKTENCIIQPSFSSLDFPVYN